MKTMRLADGDLMIGSSSDYEMVTGTKKVQQDVRLALLEPLGNDRFHIGWGSTLMDHIGEPVNEFTRQEISGEINRVVSNYSAVQRDLVERQALSDEQTTFETSEIVAAVTRIDVRPSFDSLKAKITVATLASTTTTVLVEGF